MVELAEHTLETKGTVGYRRKRAYLTYIFHNITKNKCFKAFFINITINITNFVLNRGWLTQFIFLLTRKIMLIKTVLKFRGLFSDKF